MEYETGKYRSTANMDVLRATKELLGNNQYAIDAIRSRNRRIKDLVDIITHQKLAFKEIEERYNEMANKKDKAAQKLIKLESDYSLLYDLWKKLVSENENLKCMYNTVKDERDILKVLRDRTLSRKVEIYADTVGGKRGALIKLFCTPPFTKIVSIILFVLFFIASIVGWGPVAGALKPIVKIFF